MHKYFKVTLRLTLIPVTMAISLAGCATYLPQPLTSKGVNDALKPPKEDSLKILASKLHHPLLQPVKINMHDGLSPDEAAVIAVLVNPSLRAVRDRRALADAQLLQAGLLPNPQLMAGVEPVTGGVTADTFTGYSYGAGWDLNGLITLRDSIKGAKANRSAVELDVAWQEWQIAQAARLATYGIISLQQQVSLSQQMKDRLGENLGIVRQAVDKGLMTEMDLSAAESAYNQANSNLVELQKQLRQQRLTLNQTLGLPTSTVIKLQQGIKLPSRMELPAESQILKGMEQRRLDLVALRQGYLNMRGRLCMISNCCVFVRRMVI